MYLENRHKNKTTDKNNFVIFFHEIEFKFCSRFFQTLLLVWCSIYRWSIKILFTSGELRCVVWNSYGQSELPIYFHFVASKVIDIYIEEKNPQSYRFMQSLPFLLIPVAKDKINAVFVDAVYLRVRHFVFTWGGGLHVGRSVVLYEQTEESVACLLITNSDELLNYFFLFWPDTFNNDVYMSIMGRTGVTRARCVQKLIFKNCHVLISNFDYNLKLNKYQ